MISRSNSCMLRYAMIVSIRIEAFFAVFLSANNLHMGLTGKGLMQTFPFLRRVTKKAHRFVITCLKLAIKIVGVSRINQERFITRRFGVIVTPLSRD